ncbi:MAG: LysM peptidoglycan-binding domain-containing protein [Caldilineaceae bacterium]|nr:LysM peptidoglycan-binding domain-containing protein [Caldilineaceae bacterium]
MNRTLRCCFVCIAPVILLAVLLGNLQLTIGVANAQTIVENCTDTHVVRPGETLSLLALRYATTVQTLVEINQIANPNFIRTGQVLCVAIRDEPPPTETPIDTAPIAQVVLEATYAELTPTTALDAEQRWGRRFTYPLPASAAFTSVTSAAELIVAGEDAAMTVEWLAVCPRRSTMNCTFVAVDDIAPLAALPLSTTQVMTDNAALAIRSGCTGPVSRAETAGAGFTTTGLSIWLEDPQSERQKVLEIEQVGRVGSFDELRGRCIQNDEPTYLMLQRRNEPAGEAPIYQVTIKEPPTGELPPPGVYRQWVCSRIRRAGLHGLGSKMGCL